MRVRVRVKRDVVFLVCILLLVCRNIHAQSGPPSDLDSYAARALKTFEVPGFSVAIVKDGKVVDSLLCARTK